MNLQNLMYAMGGPVDAYQAIDAHRTGLRQHPMLSGMDPQSLAQADRYAQMAQFGEQFGPEAPWYKRFIAPYAGLMGTGMLAGNEISKMIPGFQQGLYRVTGDPSFIPDESTSRPSFGNFMSGMGGLVEGMLPGLID